MSDLPWAGIILAVLLSVLMVLADCRARHCRNGMPGK